MKGNGNRGNRAQSSSAAPVDKVSLREATSGTGGGATHLYVSTSLQEQENSLYVVTGSRSVTLIVVHTHPEVVDHGTLHGSWTTTRVVGRLVEARQSKQGSGIRPQSPPRVVEGSVVLSRQTPAQANNHSGLHGPWSFTHAMNVIHLLALSVVNQNNQHVPVPANINGGSTVAMVRDFVRVNLAEFIGSEVCEDPQNFIDELKKILGVMRVTGSESVELASYQLKDVAHT
ncbi:hypothetical protein MTR67_025830 [Solanum verrucosum]|uniref:Gag-pol polyprotein n=1 Tax=Solanum verrucosum TaxID=315347 RepID=A0AAF0R499_SOLVR|nr:hypothetical protein MTR67_025830 [Solanum verrucosum]